MPQAWVQPCGTQTDSPFLSQIDQALGEGTEPDAEFFVDRWTVGLAAALENLRRRQRLKDRAHNILAWNTFSSYLPFFTVRVEASVAAAPAPRKSPAAEGSVPDPQQLCGEHANDAQSAEGDGAFGSVTLESARRLLGVAATSTREQIRSAYRNLASRYHPDRLAWGGSQVQKLAGDRMATINEAYRLLCAELERSPCKRVL
jgi:DnaJ-domain-containing protein 1